MSRRVLLLALVFGFFALIFWSGLQNRRARETTAHQPVIVTGPAEMPKPDAAQDEFHSPLEGQPAPAFQLHDLSGHTVSLAGYRGKAVLINFWATWCAPCTVEMPWLVALRQQYAAQGFEVLGIDKDYPEDLPKVPGFAAKQKLSYPVLYGDAKTYDAYKCCDYLPTSYYVDRAGRIQKATIGLGTREEMEANIRKLLASRPLNSAQLPKLQEAPEHLIR